MNEPDHRKRPITGGSPAKSMDQPYLTQSTPIYPQFITFITHGVCIWPSISGKIPGSTTIDTRFGTSVASGSTHLTHLAHNPALERQASSFDSFRTKVTFQPLQWEFKIHIIDVVKRIAVNGRFASESFACVKLLH